MNRHKGTLKLKLVALNTREQYVPPLNVICNVRGASILLDGVDTGFHTNHRFITWTAGVYSLQLTGYTFDPVSITETDLPPSERTIDFSGVVAAGTLPTEGGILHNGYIYHIFEADGELKVLADVDVEYLIVGAGGGGRGYNVYWGGGGGGAGGVIEGSATLTANTYPVTIGVGVAGDNGQDTVFNSMIAIGGGCGGRGYTTSGQAANGGSGGGGGSWYTTSSYTQFGGSPEPGQGHKGGDYDPTQYQQGGHGGGGYGSAGIDRGTLNQAIGTNGGSGKLLSDIFSGLLSGANIGLSFDGVAGGGGGGARDGQQKGYGGGEEDNPYGAGDGNEGAALAGTNGIDGTGSGGGGDYNYTSGGSGIVIVRYAI